jgi:hypothetical protein
MPNEFQHYHGRMYPRRKRIAGSITQRLHPAKKWPDSGGGQLEGNIGAEVQLKRAKGLLKFNTSSQRERCGAS